MTKFLDRLLSGLDRMTEAKARGAARRHGRRSFLARAGGAIVGGVALAPILPFDRRAKAAGAAAAGDECGSWRHCAIDGFLCQDAGGTLTSCPPGSSVSAVSWVGTCTNPDDNKDYLVSYNDCCGKPLIPMTTFCYNSKGERPGYRMGLYNDVNWCMANEAKGYHCTVSVVVGLAE